MIKRAVESKPSRAIGPSAALWSVLFLALATLSTSVSCAMAQNIASTPVPATSGARPPGPGVAPAKSPAIATTQLAWRELTSQQQVALKPLAAKWASLPDSNRRKWLAISKNYASLPAAEQAKMHSRMSEWVSLSQRQRSEARLQYAQTKQLTPAEKAATWQAYQALSVEEREKLAAKAAPKPVGAATATKPVPPQKLAVVPVTRKTPTRSAKIAIARDAVDQKTLLPRSHPASDAVVIQNH